VRVHDRENRQRETDGDCRVSTAGLVITTSASASAAMVATVVGSHERRGPMCGMSAAGPRDATTG